MAERPKKWWKSRPAPDPRGEWKLLYTFQTPLSGAWQRMESLADRYQTDCYNWAGLAPADPALLEHLGACPECERWDRSTVTAPIDVPLMPTNRKLNIVAKTFYSKLWIFKPFSSPLTVIHRRLLDAIGEDFDENILLGEVYVLGGDRIPDLVSVVDRAPFPCRVRYRKSLFNHPGSPVLRPCLHCGRLHGFKQDSPDYILTGETQSRSPRFCKSEVLLSPETCQRSDFADQTVWPKLKMDSLKEHAEPADPMPVPYPVWWDEMEQWFTERGFDFPFHKVQPHPSIRFGPWITDRIRRLGKAACVGNAADDHRTSAVFYLRLRALFEPKVAERIDGLTDEDLIRYIADYSAATEHRVGYFPI